MATSHVGAMSIGSTLAMPKMSSSMLGLVELRSGSSPSRGRLINRWWVGVYESKPETTGNAGKCRVPVRTYKVLRLDVRSIARRFAEFDADPTAGASTARPTTNERKNPAGNARNAEK